MKHAAIGPIEIYLPEKLESNDQLQAEFPKWDMDLIYSKTGDAQVRSTLVWFRYVSLGDAGL